jgi:hypothetical protein
MYDDFRDDSSSSYYGDEQAQPAASAASRARSRPSRFLGMTSIQRFVLAFMLMLVVCIIGALLLFVMGKIAF